MIVHRKGWVLEAGAGTAAVRECGRVRTQERIQVRLYGRGMSG